MDVFLPNHRRAHPPVRGGDAIAGVLRYGGASDLLAGSQEDHPGPHREGATGTRPSAVYGG